ncbi:MAG TPA: penicillin-binding protein 2, partial [Candidatus Glassbacteria bacterium]|nr:penicillin-binding protein 2 [Candidatus Glassbacteria bacterium]
LQVFQSDSFQRQARRQQERTIEVSPVRGVLYDRNHRPLAISVEVESVFAVPGEIRNPVATAKLLAPVLEMEKSLVGRRLQGSRYFSWVKRKVTARQAARLRQLNLQGIYFQRESKRFYPKAELAAHTLGHVGVDDQGLAGIELGYDEVLHGRPGQLLIERDARQRWLRRTGRPPQPGQNLVLTLDENIQYIAERELAAAFQQSRALSGSVIVQDPHTGEILALANQPTFNPNRYSGTDAETLRNLAVSAAYEPGSTFKILTVAAALEEKLAEPEERIDCQMGSIVLAGHTIRDHKAFGILSVEQIMQQSSDVGAIKLALRLGKESFYQYVRSFGFGSATGIELPGEAVGLTKPPERWSKISIGAMAMGQEIGVTPLQIASMASTVANGGWWVRPRIVRGDPADRTAESKPVDDRRRVLSRETAAILQRMMS